MVHFPPAPTDHYTAALQRFPHLLGFVVQVLHLPILVVSMLEVHQFLQR